MAEFEFAGMTFRGGKMMVILTALSTLGGVAWAGFEFYADYMDMKEIVQNIDTDAIEARNIQIEQKLDDAIEYTRDIKSGLRDDILSIERQADRVEDKVLQRNIISHWIDSLFVHWVGNSKRHLIFDEWPPPIREGSLLRGMLPP